MGYLLSSRKHQPARPARSGTAHFRGSRALSHPGFTPKSNPGLIQRFLKRSKNDLGKQTPCIEMLTDPMVEDYTRRNFGPLQYQDCTRLLFFVL